MRDLKTWAVVAAGYLAVRLALIVGWSPVEVNDSASYERISLVGDAPRLWVYPVVRTLPNGVVMFLQVAISAIAFVVLAAAVASTVTDRRVRVGVAGVVLALGVTPRVTVWDGVMLSESLAISMTALLLAVVVRWRALPGSVIVAAFIGWVFVRDAHAVLGVAVAACLGVLLWRERRRATAVAVAVVALWGVAATQNDRYVEGFNVTANVAHRIARDPGHLVWFERHGMPSVDTTVTSTPEGLALQGELNSDETFQDWAAGPGATTYARFLATHPGFTLSGLAYLVADDDVIAEAMFDQPFGTYTDPNAQWLSVLWPNEGSIWMTTSAVVGLAGVALLVGRRDRRWMLPAALIASTIPHALLVYHGAPIEIARHATVMNLVLVVGCVMAISAAVDLLLVGSADLESGHAARALGDEMSRVDHGEAVDGRQVSRVLDRADRGRCGRV